MNKYIMKLEKGKQLSYGPIYSLKPEKIEILKTNIKTNLKNEFIKSFKSFIDVFIFFN